MTNEIKDVIREFQRHVIKVVLIALISMAVVCVVACVSMAYQVTEIAEDYFNYEYNPTITQTQTVNN